VKRFLDIYKADDVSSFSNQAFAVDGSTTSLKDPVHNLNDTEAVARHYIKTFSFSMFKSV